MKERRVESYESSSVSFDDHIELLSEIRVLTIECFRSIESHQRNTGSGGRDENVLVGSRWSSCESADSNGSSLVEPERRYS